ncbi:MAG: hypothetical protein JWM69_1651, partial [Candidatus Binatus sp.]|nr:hypothetical protein [Candidatus Binatus sp.]
MTRRSSAAMIAAFSFVAILCGSPEIRAASTAVKKSAPTGQYQASALETMAAAHFGNDLSAAERKLLRGAPMRMVPWLGPDNNPDNLANDAAHGDQWGSDRTVRAEIVEWLAADPDVSRLVHPSGLAMAAGRIKGNLDLSYLTVDKPITLVRCYLPDGIDISSAHLQELDVRRSRTGPVAGDNVTVLSDVSFRAGDYGPISLYRARVDGSLDFSASHVMNGGQNAISIVEATIGGDATFDSLTTDGIVDARLATIHRALDFHDATFKGEGGLNAERAVINGTFYWTEIKRSPKTMLDLENARAGAIWDDAASWPAPGNLVINGFIYNEIAGGPVEASDRLRWLSLQPPGYSPQPYRQLAKVLGELGRESGVTAVRIEKEIALRRFGHMTMPQRAWSL